VGGGVESLAHPRYGEVSWDNSQVWYCYSPDPYVSFMYAASAALAATVLDPYDSPRATALATNAASAYAWAKAHRSDPQEGRQPRVGV
jgi:hypothetical protein